MSTYETFDEPLEEIEEIPSHGTVTNSGIWICEQDDCDGINHYYVRAV